MNSFKFSAMICNLVISGEFTQENQQRRKNDEEKELTKFDPWKVFEQLVVGNKQNHLFLLC
jgi:hypothetical protein